MFSVDIGSFVKLILHSVIVVKEYILRKLETRKLFVILKRLSRYCLFFFFFFIFFPLLFCKETCVSIVSRKNLHKLRQIHEIKFENFYL